MSSSFPVHPVARFAGASQPVKRPKEFACFSYDEEHKFRLDDSSLKWYYPPALGSSLSRGYEDFVKLDESQPEHVDSLLKTIANHERESGNPIDAQVVTWRGIMTKIMSAPFEDRDGLELNATLYRGCIFVEENHDYRMAMKKEQESQTWRGPISQEVMSFWGYKFEALSTLPAPWAETSRDYIENRDNLVVSNKEQYCSVVRTGIGSTILCLGGEVDAVWDAKPAEKGAPINWVELKTSAEIRSDRDMDNFERKMMKFWIQSFLLGVPKIIVGFRSREGVLVKLEEIETATIPETARRRGRAGWDGNTCINFASAFLEWLRNVITDEGVWRIKRNPKSPTIEIFKVEETGHGSIVTDEFINWRIRLSLIQAQSVHTKDTQDGQP